MPADEINEQDGGTDGIDSVVERPSPTAEQEQNIQDALDRFFGKASPEELGESEGQEDEEPRQNVSYRRKEQKRQEAEELEEEGLEDEDKSNQDEPEPVEDAEQAKDEPEDAPPAPVAKNEQKKKDIDPSLRFFAEQELGWSKERLDRLVAADPELAEETIRSLADDSLNLSRQFLSRPGPQVAPGTPASVEPPAQQSPTSKLDEFYSNLEAFAESNGQELADVFKLLKAEVIDPVREMIAANEQRAQELERTEARTHFGTIASKFAGLYGDPEGPSTALSEEQQRARALLAQTADELRAGAKLAGREMSVKAALNKAHLLVSREYAAGQVRKEIKEQVQRRSNAITARPTQRRNPATAAPRSRAAAEEALARLAAERGIEWDGD